MSILGSLPQPPRTVDYSFPGELRELGPSDAQFTHTIEGNLSVNRRPLSLMHEICD